MPYDNNMSGMIAPNQRKQQANHPDFSGQCEIDGKQYWISGWVKVGKEGSKLAGKEFFSLAFKPKDAAPAAAPSGGATKSYAQPIAGATAAAAPGADGGGDVPY